MKTFAVVCIVACALFAQVHCWGSKDSDSESNEYNDQKSQHNSGDSHVNHHEHDKSNNMNQQWHFHNGAHDASYHDKHVGWDWAVADLPDAVGYVNKINMRLDQLPETEQSRGIKERVINYANTNLANCKSHIDQNKLHKHCVGQLTGTTMSLIGRLQNEQQNGHSD